MRTLLTIRPETNQKIFPAKVLELALKESVEAKIWDDKIFSEEAIN
jgi:hypothetical protein